MSLDLYFVPVVFEESDHRQGVILSEWSDHPSSAQIDALHAVFHMNRADNRKTTAGVPQTLTELLSQVPMNVALDTLAALHGLDDLRRYVTDIREEAA